MGVSAATTQHCTIDESSVSRESPATYKLIRITTCKEAASPHVTSSSQPIWYNDVPSLPPSQPPPASAPIAGPSRIILVVPSKIPPTTRTPHQSTLIPTVTDYHPRALAKLHSVPAILKLGDDVWVLDPTFPADINFIKKMEQSITHHIIAHNTAHGISKGDSTWVNAALEKLEMLTGSNTTAAPKVCDVTWGWQPSARVVNEEHWWVMQWLTTAELLANDLFQVRTWSRTQGDLGDISRSLGLMGKWELKPNWLHS